MKETNFISIIIYYQKISPEQREYFLKKIFETFLVKFKNYEIIIVNNSEGKEEIQAFAKQLSSYVTHNTVTVVNLSKSTGKEAAMIAGDDLAVGDYIFEFDNINIEFSDTLLMDSYLTLLQGYDVVAVGAAEKEKSFASALFYWLFNKGVGQEQQIHPEVFRIVSRRAFNRAKSMAKSLSYRKAVYATGGLKRYYSQDQSLKALKKKDEKSVDYNVRLGMNVLMIFTSIMQKISTIVCGFFLMATLLISGYVVYIFALKKPVEGWTPIMLYLSVGFLGIFVILALILRFLSVVLDVVYKNEIHNVESIWKV